MALTKVSVTLPDGRQAQAVDVKVSSAIEPWSEYTLDDGTHLKAKMNVVNIYRVENEYDALGQPVYQVNTAMTIAFVSVPDKLKRLRQ